MKKPLTKLIFTAISITILLHSCSDNIGITGGGGREGEVVVVLNEEYQKGGAGKIIDEVLNAPYMLMPQYEPMFKLYIISWQSFTETFKAFRNIIKIDIGTKYTDSKAKLQQNKSQTVITLTSPTVDEFVDLFKKHSSQIVNALSMSEVEFARDKIKKGTDKSIEKHIEKKHNIKINVPKGYEIRRDTSDFLFMSLETNQLTLGLILYYYPYKDKNSFTADYLLNKRDSVLMQHIKGPLYPNKMSYMTTSRTPLTPIFKETMTNNNYTAEIRGLWSVTEDFMGGPFISTSRVDSERARIVTIEGFVYYPNNEKRKYMRWFEALLSDVTFTPKELK